MICKGDAYSSRIRSVATDLVNTGSTMLTVEESTAATAGPVLPTTALLLLTLPESLSEIIVGIVSVWML